MFSASTSNEKDRKPVRLPVAMVDEVDRLVDVFPIFGNRQQFIESAVREKIVELKQLEAGLQPLKKQRH